MASGGNLTIHFDTKVTSEQIILFSNVTEVMFTLVE